MLASTATSGAASPATASGAESTPPSTGGIASTLASLSQIMSGSSSQGVPSTSRHLPARHVQSGGHSTPRHAALNQSVIRAWRSRTNCVRAAVEVSTSQSSATVAPRQLSAQASK
jgi:hypothetical protein